MTIPSDAPLIVVAGRDRMLESATIAAIGIRAADCYYPRAPGQSALPLMVIEG